MLVMKTSIPTLVGPALVGLALFAGERVALAGEAAPLPAAALHRSAPSAPWHGSARSAWFAEDVDLMRLVNVDYRKGRPLPSDIQALDGKQIRLEGYMSQDTAEGVTTFLLTYDACGCNGQKLQHFVEVTLTDELVKFTPGKIAVEGTFEVGEVEDEFGIVTSIYRLEAESYEE